MRDRPRKTFKNGAETHRVKEERVDEGLGQLTDHQGQSEPAVATPRLKYLRMTLTTYVSRYYHCSSERTTYLGRYYYCSSVPPI